MLRTAINIVLLNAAFLVSACENTEEKKTGAAKNARKTDPDSSADPDPKIEKVMKENNKESAVDLSDLFHDKIDIKTSDFNVFTACGDLFASTGEMKKMILPWPAKTKGPLIKELNKMPISKKISEAVIGYYLVKSGGLDDAAGLLCGTKESNRGVIFIDEKTFSDENIIPTEHMSSNYTLRTLPVAFSLWTVIHETMHAIDHYFYADPKTGMFSKERKKASTLAWTDFTDSKYKKIGILSLSGTGLGERNRACNLSLKPNKQLGGFGLLGDSPEQDSQDLEYMEKKTNFITPYTMTNSFEDFADTNTTYYIGTRKLAWPVWKTYGYDITQSALDESKVEYEYQAKKVISSSKSHRQKMCALAALVFDEECDAKLP